MDGKSLKVVIIVQARMGSTRLPGKVLKEVLGKPLLHYLMERLKMVDCADEIVIATTLEPQDQKIVDFCLLENIAFFRGKSEDVLDRYYFAAKAYKADVIVRITADCPLLDPVVIDQVIKEYLDSYPKYDYVSNCHVRSFPVGMDLEVFSFKSLEEAFLKSRLEEEREHVTPFIYRNPDRFNIHLISYQKNLSELRLTLDTEEDYRLISQLLHEIYIKNPRFSMDDLVKILLVDHPEWKNINSQVKQKKLSH